MGSETDCVLVLTTLPIEADAEAFAARLVEERLAACVAIHAEMQSVYRWDGRVTRDRERQLVIKTAAARTDALLARLRELHPYDLPERLVIPVAAGGEDYLRWVRDGTLGS
ncbi:MAG TPA: divalent-cation tolerance protein CutA [Vicinamibacterales bacterium]|nr:divalent-cation tolerance protein CutA [Vicinamibacterales bacterium]